jgi:hypothetical protein
MSRFGTYFVRFRTMRNDLTGLPPWARVIFIAAALPGIALVGLSFVAVAISIVALLLLTVPVYALLRAMTGVSEGTEVTGVATDGSRPQARHVDVKVLDANVPDEVNGE